MLIRVLVFLAILTAFGCKENVSNSESSVTKETPKEVKKIVAKVSKNDVVGSWKEERKSEDSEDYFISSFNEDGTYTVKVLSLLKDSKEYDLVDIKGKWTLSENIITLKSGGDSLKLEIVEAGSGKLNFKEDGEIKKQVKVEKNHPLPKPPEGYKKFK